LGASYARQSEGAGQADSSDAPAISSQATITAEQARTAALGTFPDATITAIELEDENGAAAYGVRLTDSAGTRHDVKVDALSGKVLDAQDDGPGADERNTEPEAPDTD
jgi:uncharacterized membrane protein YkoI